jgi:hypothetical protein
LKFLTSKAVFTSHAANLTYGTFESKNTPTVSAKTTAGIERSAIKQAVNRLKKNNIFIRFIFV